MQSRLEKQAFQADVIERKNKEAIEFLKELITVAIPPRKAGISRRSRYLKRLAIKRVVGRVAIPPRKAGISRRKEHMLISDNLTTAIQKLYARCNPA